ncbi:hypothetical protein Dsin_017751 [Dipteronia sinensis]|uniref:Neprosin PEP catalytic domain-containing protein n=1 Tax=Dipteronia sinensis TaxID=43782 RepID=A0AAE0AFP4_9ROSI|nr:hypothetical protein Dsin_017751 [Dipteronia sinensis]
MGSGSFAQTRYSLACFINNMRIKDANSMQLKFPEPIQPLADQDNCYNIIYDIKGPFGEPIFFFGGPGQNPNCICSVDANGIIGCILMRPSSDLPTEKLDTRNELSSQEMVILQTWQKSGSCPKGTIPIRRIRRQDLLRAASLEQFGIKPPNKEDPKFEWGGEVYSEKVKRSPHTNTQMGSGSSAHFHYGSACYANNLRIQDALSATESAEKFPESLQTWTDETYSYNTLYDINGPPAEPIFYFGGPGTYTDPPKKNRLMCNQLCT